MPPSDCLDLPEDRRSGCPIASTLDLLGDKWTLLVVRDLLFLRKRRFGEFLESPEHIPTNILTDRLRRLEEHGVVEKALYQQHPRRYEYRLTPKGLDLYPIVMAIVHWGDVHMSGKKGRPLLHKHQVCGKTFDPVVVCSECGEPIDPKRVHVHPGPGADSARHLPPDLQPVARKRRRPARARASR